MAPNDTEQGAEQPSEQSPLLGTQALSSDDPGGSPPIPEGKITTIIWAALAGVFVIGLVLVFVLPVQDWDDPFPSPETILKSAPVIDGHIGSFVLPRTYGPQHPAYRATRFTRTCQSSLCEQCICLQS